MRALAAVDILEVAEAGADRGPATQALEILRRAAPEIDAHQLALGRRDALLLDLRTRLVGPKLDLVSSCPDCGERLELSVGAEELGLVPAAANPPSTKLTVDGREIVVSPITAGSLADAERLADVDLARRHLLATAAPEATEEVLAEVEDLVDRLDPGAETIIDWTCPVCAATWSETLDAAAILQNDMQVKARGILLEVAALARIYHWSERDILAMPERRRRFYLEALD